MSNSAPLAPLILYVDDELPNRVVFEQTFGRRFRIRCVPSATEALAILDQEAVAVLITDQRMPDMSGNQLLHRAMQTHPDVIRIVITAFSDLDPILQAVNEGICARYIIKPWDRAELEKVLEWAVDAHEVGRESASLQFRLLENERLAALGTLVTAVLHDINQPLSYLRYNSERLAQLSGSAPELGKLLPSLEHRLGAPDLRNLEAIARELPEMSRDMLIGTTVMSEITGNMRRFLRRSVPEEIHPCDPIPVIRYSLSVCKGLIAGTVSRLSYDGPRKLPRASISATELTQVLINLIANAVHALERKEPPGSKVRLHVREAPGGIEFTIEDDGAGMSAEVLTKLGTPFFSTRPEGTGLGVLQCRRLVERAGGQLQIKSVQGEGTTVSFFVPTRARPPGETP